MTQEQLTAIGALICEIESANKGNEMMPQIVARMLRNPADNVFHYWFAKTINSAIVRSDDLIGTRLADLRQKAGEITRPKSAEGSTIALAYYKAKANVQDVRKVFGERVKAQREDMGLSQAELAERTGLLQSHISRIESGRYNVTLDTIAMLSSVLGDISYK